MADQFSARDRPVRRSDKEPRLVLKAERLLAALPPPGTRVLFERPLPQMRTGT
ncbi:hypothetical protein [Micromonospora coerulea]|uniref:hypothetical protein n=1 Tax=Micromonospora coerulea TaxID=47856 RepID=UPI0031F9D6F5